MAASDFNAASAAPPDGRGDRATRARTISHAPGRSSDDAPRERLTMLGAGALSDAELLALVLRTGSARIDSLGVARALLADCGGLRRLALAPLQRAAQVHGIGPAKAASLAAALELGWRVGARRLSIGVALRRPRDAYEHYRLRLRDERQEVFVVLLLDARQRVLGESTVSRGTLTASLVHPREVFRPALQAAASSVLLIHNHPSGDPSPSAEDREVTRRLARAGELLGVRVIDHVVVAEQGFYSFREAGELEAPEPGATGARAGGPA